jgi:excisionase family DNA binding protein
MLQMSEDLKPFEAAENEQVAIDKLNEALAQAAATSRPYLVGSDGERIVLPDPLFRMLREAAIRLSRKERIVIAPVDKEISTQEASDLLGVSRPYLVKLLDTGEIQYVKTGRYRRLRYGDVIAYRERRNTERNQRLAQFIKDRNTANSADIS